MYTCCTSKTNEVYLTDEIKSMSERLTEHISKESSLLRELNQCKESMAPAQSAFNNAKEEVEVSS